jgi:hypothetical protein
VRRLLFAPSWIARHLLALTLVAVFIRMGIWQLTKGESPQGTLQNLFYGIEWPIFAAFVVYWWFKMMKEELAPKDHTGPQWGVGGRIAPETAWQPDLGDGPRMLIAAAETSEEDEEVDAYNRYLTALYERDALREALRQVTPQQIENARRPDAARQIDQVDPSNRVDPPKQINNPKQINGAR